MHLLLIDSDDTGLDLAYRAAEAGHDVRIWTKPNPDKSKVWTGHGFKGIERVNTWQPSMTWVGKQGLVVNLFNDQKLTAELDRWRSFGIPIFGPTVQSANLEWNRGDGMIFM